MRNFQFALDKFSTAFIDKLFTKKFILDLPILSNPPYFSAKQTDMG